MEIREAQTECGLIMSNINIADSANCHFLIWYTFLSPLNSVNKQKQHIADIAYPHHTLQCCITTTVMWSNKHHIPLPSRDMGC